ncbi:MAG: hypothetical protein GY851_21180 [bacterium]|nr:hypothetical protein [bacterium]
MGTPIAGMTLSCLVLQAGEGGIVDAMFDQEIPHLYEPGRGLPETAPDGSAWTGYVHVRTGETRAVAITASGLRVGLRFRDGQWACRSRGPQPAHENGGAGSGMSMHEGTFYLLPYHLARAHGFLN